MAKLDKNRIVEDIDFQQILTNPILDIAARFWDEERYHAFKVCYRSMRVIDNLVDDHKITGNISVSTKRQLTNAIHNWIQGLTSSRPQDEQQQGLIDTMAKFKIPVWPWQYLAESMVYDLNNNGFATFCDFLIYTEGAAVAPGSVFMHLCGVHKKKNGYNQPPFDILEAARPLARFSYLVHIIRDFQKDQQSGLNYFADDILSEIGISGKQLTSIATGHTITSEFRRLMERYHSFIDCFRLQSRQMLDKVNVNLELRYILSLEILFSLYLQIFERINLVNGTFTTEELNPRPEEIKERIMQTVASFEY